MSQSAIKLYGFPLSGHSHRVELMLSLLGLPREFILVDLKHGAQKARTLWPASTPSARCR